MPVLMGMTLRSTHSHRTGAQANASIAESNGIIHMINSVILPRN